jgi:hypothetical protein
MAGAATITYVVAPGDVISHLDMCRDEGVNLQRGMNFGSSGRPSVILMSRRPGALTTTASKRMAVSSSMRVMTGHSGPLLDHGRITSHMTGFSDRLMARITKEQGWEKAAQFAATAEELSGKPVAEMTREDFLSTFALQELAYLELRQDFEEMKTRYVEQGLDPREIGEFEDRFPPFPDSPTDDPK